jgi:creatinine amidohydrolase
MYTIIHYDELTWPEISQLPRDLPVIIPLGDGYELESLFSKLDGPDRIVILPPFPFGWTGSSLEIDELILSRYISNLFSSLHEDGFINTCLLTPPGIDLQTGVKNICFSNLNKMPSGTNLPTTQAHEKVVLIPIGHTEQHAFHLPMATDTIIIDAIATGTRQCSPEICFNLPVMPYGVSTHRNSFTGTLNAGGREFEDFWLEVVKNLSGQGYSKMYFLSGHGGNCSFLVNIVKYAGERFKRIFCATSWLYLNGPKGIASLEYHRESKLGGMGHACELETSLILHLRPDLVHMERVRDDTSFISTPSYYMDWIEGGSLIANPPWEDDSIYGAYGSGSLGTSEKGKSWLEAAILEKIDHVLEINDQHLRREIRRNSGFGQWGLDKEN